MLFKLMKYDFKSMLRTFLPLWSIVILLSFGNFIIPADNPFEGSGSIAILIITALLIAVFSITVILVIQRFYNGLLKDEGYLTFTLPVKTWQLVLSKYITAITIVLLSSAVGCIAIILLSTKGWISQYIWDEFITEIGNIPTQLFVILGLAALISVLDTIAKIYLSMAVGHLFYKLRVPISIGAYIVINTIMSEFTNLLTSTHLGAFALENVSQTDSWSTFTEAFVNSGVYVSLGISALIVVGYLALTILILNKRLNLE